MNTPDKNSVLAGVCTIMPLLVTTSLDARIYTNTDLGLSPISIGAGNTSVAWDVDGNSVTDFTLNVITTNNVISLYPGAGAKVLWNTTWSHSLAVHKFDAGAVIWGAGPAPANLQFRSNPVNLLNNNNVANGNLSAAFSSGSAGYIGFYFSHDGHTSSGWASITVTGGSGSLGSVTINSWAFESTEDPIQVGAVPEPSETAIGLGALALGAVGLRRWRSQKVA
jgi:hypothetical protein